MRNSSNSYNKTGVNAGVRTGDRTGVSGVRTGVSKLFALDTG